MNKPTAHLLNHLLFLLFGAVITFLIMRDVYSSKFDQMQAMCLEEVDLAIGRRDSLWENKWLPPRLSAASRKATEARDQYWKEKLLPGLLDSAALQGAHRQDSIWQQRLPAIVFTADSTGFERGKKATEEVWQVMLQDTLCQMQQEMEILASDQFKAGLAAGRKAGPLAAGASNSKNLVIQQLLHNGDARLAIAILAFGLGFLIMKFFSRRSTRVLLSWNRH